MSSDGVEPLDEKSRIDRRTALKGAIAAGAGAAVFAAPAINGISVVPLTAAAQSGGGEDPQPFTVTTDNSGAAMCWSTTAGCFPGIPGRRDVDLGVDGYFSMYMIGCITLGTGALSLGNNPNLPFTQGYRAPSGYTCTFTMSGSGDCSGLNESGMNPTDTNVGGNLEGAYIRTPSDGNFNVCGFTFLGGGGACIDTITCTPV